MHQSSFIVPDVLCPTHREHREVLNLVCLDKECCRLICRLCCSDKHTQHQVVSLPKFREDVNEKRFQEGNSASLDNSFEQIKGLKATIMRAVDELRRTIDSHIDALM